LGSRVNKLTGRELVTKRKKKALRIIKSGIRVNGFTVYELADKETGKLRTDD